MIRRAEENADNSGRDYHNCIGSLPPSAQIAHAISELSSRDETILEWDFSIRQALLREGYACLLLAKNIPAVGRQTKHALSTHEPELAPGDPNKPNKPDGPEDSASQKVSPLVSLYPNASQSSAAGVSTSIHQRDPSQEYNYFFAPKLVLVIVSPPIRAFLEQNPHSNELVLPNPYGDFKPKAMHAITLWLCQLLQDEEPRPIDCMADRKAYTALIDALDIRVAMQLLGMEPMYLPHFVPLYTASLSQRRPTTLEAKAIVAHTITEACSAVEDDAVVCVLAQRLAEPERKGRLDNAVWTAFLRKGSNRGLLAAVQKNGRAFQGVQSVILPSPPHKIEHTLEEIVEIREHAESIAEASLADTTTQSSDQELQEDDSLIQTEHVHGEKKSRKTWKSQMTSRMSVGWGKMRRIASGSSNTSPRE